MKRFYFLFPKGIKLTPKGRRARRGQTLVEYSLIIAVIVIAVLGVVLTVGKQTTTLYSSIQSQVARTGTGS